MRRYWFKKKISYSSHANKTPLHQRDFALTLVLKVRDLVTVGKEEKVGQQRKASRAIPGLPLANREYFLTSVERPLDTL